MPSAAPLSMPPAPAGPPDPSTARPGAASRFALTAAPRAGKPPPAGLRATGPAGPAVLPAPPPPLQCRCPRAPARCAARRVQAPLWHGPRPPGARCLAASRKPGWAIRLAAALAPVRHRTAHRRPSACRTAGPGRSGRAGSRPPAPPAAGRGGRSGWAAWGSDGLAAWPPSGGRRCAAERSSLSRARQPPKVPLWPGPNFPISTW